MKRIIQKYSATLEINENMAAKISQQYLDLKFVISEKVKSGSIKSFTDMSYYLLENSDFEELSTVVDICGTCQASSADCERGFSLMNPIKSKSRKRFDVSHLNDLMRIKSYLFSGREISPDRVYTYRISNKDRREKICDA